MRFKETPITGVRTIEQTPFSDDRGSFARIFCSGEMRGIGVNKPIAQINHSHTAARGALRGMHFQYPPACEVKVIHCLRGAVYDVVIDIRRDSPTFLHWFGVELSRKNRLGVVVPEGCAHGFQTLEADSELIYMHTAPYSPELEGAIRHDDPLVGIAWPLPVTDVSRRDASHPLLDSSFPGLALE